MGPQTHNRFCELCFSHALYSQSGEDNSRIIILAEHPADSTSDKTISRSSHDQTRNNTRRVKNLATTKTAAANQVMTLQAMMLAWNDSWSRLWSMTSPGMDFGCGLSVALALAAVVLDMTTRCRPRHGQRT